MHDLLSIPSPSPLTAFPLSPTSQVILKALNPLHDPKDGAFLQRPDHMAGRHVCIVLYAISNSRDERERAWKDKVHDGVNLAELGRGAKLIENAGYNWRELTDHDDVLAAAETLKVPGATH